MAMGMSFFLISLLLLSLGLESSSEEVTLALAMCDEAGMNKEQFRSDQRLLEFGRQYNQTLSLIKSLLISWRHGKTDPTFCKNGNDSLKVIIFSNNRPIFDKLKSTVGSWNEKYTAPLNLEYRAAIFPEEFKWMENLFAPCNSLRFGLPQLLKDYTRVISLDTDILFFRDVRILWNQFNLFNEKTSLAAAPCVHEGGRRYAVKISRHLGVRIDKKEVERVPSINGGVLLMDLTKLRQAWSKDWFSRVDKYGSEISARPCQALLNLYFYMNPDALLRLSHTWNYIPYVNVTMTGKRDKPYMRLSGISVLHGAVGAFFKPGLPRNLYEEFHNADLSLEFSIQAFTTRLKRLLSYPKKSGEEHRSKPRSSSQNYLKQVFLKYIDELAIETETGHCRRMSDRTLIDKLN